MEWKIIFDQAFRDWLYEQEESVQDAILAYIGLVKNKGPLLRLPYVDTIQRSRYPHLKELRVQP